MINEGKKGFWKFAEYLLYIFFFLFPLVSYNGFLYGGTSIRAINLMFLASLLLITFGIRSFKKDSSVTIQKSPIFIAMLIYFVLVFISAVNGINFNVSFWSVATRTTGIIYFINLGFFIYFLSNSLINRKIQDSLILTVLISTAIYSFLAFLGPEGLKILFNGYESDAFTFGNSTFAGMYLFGAFILSIYYVVKAEKKSWWHYVLPILIVVNPNFINMKPFFGDETASYVGEARASTYLIIFASLIMVVFWLIAKVKSQKFKKITSYSIFAVSTLIMIFSVFSLLSDGGLVRNLYLSQASGVRPLIWDLSKNVIAERPLLGWGTDSFDRLFELNYDNRVLEDFYGNEAWLDRSHNVIVDQSVENGFLGLTAYIAVFLVIVVCLLYVLFNSKNRQDRVLATFLIIYFPLHLIELQTAFDTTISYIMVALMISLSVALYTRTREESSEKSPYIEINNQYLKYAVSSLMVVWSCWVFFYGFIPFVSAQQANVYIRKVGSPEKRIDVYPQLFSSPIDKHAFLWRISVDFQRGLAEDPSILADPNKVVYMREELQIIEDEYRKYISENPNHFRAHLNLADILIYQKLFDVDKLEEAQKVLDTAISIVPQSPQPYWMKAVAYVYMGKFDLAREWAQKSVDLNPEITRSHWIVDYVEKSAKSYPEIDLVFFNQI